MSTIKAEQLLQTKNVGWSDNGIDDERLKERVIARLVALVKMTVESEDQRRRWRFSGSSIQFNGHDVQRQANEVWAVIERGFEAGTFRVLYVTPTAYCKGPGDWTEIQQAGMVFKSAEIEPLLKAMDETGLVGSMVSAKVIADAARLLAFEEAFEAVDPT